VVQHIAYPRLPRKLPVILSFAELQQVFDVIPNLKHRAALMTAYAAGLRVSEVVALKVADIDSQRMVIRVEQGKGCKDRYVMLSPRLLILLRTYWKTGRPKEWLFPGAQPNQHLSARTLQAVCHDA
jgi:integrase/recombinase XerD